MLRFVIRVVNSTPQAIVSRGPREDGGNFLFKDTHVTFVEGTWD